MGHLARPDGDRPLLRTTYPWKRFWHLRQEPVQLDNSGYLLDPGGELGSFANAKLATTAEVAVARCFVLLGEAGSGKSTELEGLEAAVRDTDKGGLLVPIDLGRYGGEDQLHHDVFESDLVHSWLAGTGPLTLLLDSLDEAMVEIRKVTATLERGIEKLPCERLHLGIACRATAWPETLTHFLRDRFGEEEVGVWQLAPLRRADVAIAARGENLDVDNFLAALEATEAVPFATNPASLWFLLDIHRRDQDLPKRRVDLYKLGLQALCEPSDIRRDRGSTSETTAAEHLEIAARLAATTVLTGRTALYDGPAPNREDADMAVCDVSGGCEGSGSALVGVTQAAITKTLTETGLFRGRGERRFEFTHKSYAEYLAARYLYRARLPKSQLDSVLYVFDEGGSRLAPQLHETAAWLAALDPGFFDEILQTEPEVLVLSDVASLDDERKARLVDALFARLDSGQLSHSEVWDLHPQWGRLIHPGLSDQILAVVDDTSRSRQAREAATDVARSCQLTSLAERLAALAVDHDEDYEVRRSAAVAVVRLGVPAARQMLKPLVTGPSEHDPDGRLRECALMATWPQFLTAEELFEALSPSGLAGSDGAYSTFLYHNDIAEQLHACDLPAALGWALQFTERRPVSNSLSSLAARLAYRGWQALEEPGVLEPLAELVLGRMQDHAPAIPTPEATAALSPDSDTCWLHSEKPRRRALVQAVMNRIANPADVTLLVWGETRLAFAEDFAWALEHARGTDGEQACKWAELAKRLYDLDDPEHLSLWLEAKKSCPVIAEVIDWPTQMQLDSPEARAAREQYATWKEWAQRREQHQLRKVHPAPVVRVMSAARQCVAGEANLFSALAAEMTLRPDSEGHEIPTHLKREPGWETASQETRRVIVEAARTYLAQADIERGDLLTSNIHYVADLSPSLAVALLLEEDPVFLDTLDRDRWETLTPFLLAAPVGLSTEDDVRRQQIAALTYSNAPDKFRETVLTLLEQRKGADAGMGHLIGMVETCPDESLAAAVLERLRQGGFAPNALGATLAWLLRRNVEGTRAYAESLVAGEHSSAAQDRATSIEAAVVLLCCTPDAAWDVVWPAIQANTEWGKAVLERAVRGQTRDSAGLECKLSEQAIGEVLRWLYQRFPPERESAQGYSYIQSWRDTLRVHLRKQGTRDACTALRQLHDAFPQYPWLNDDVLHAQRALRRAAWTPPTPEQVLKLVADRRVRFVATGLQLLDVLQESLHLLQAQLHGQTPMAPFFWDQLSPVKWRPKSEPYLSDLLVHHLRSTLIERGVILNREVEIRRRTSSAGESGQQTDIHVDAIAPATGGVEADRLTVIIEVKGCWHREVKTAMQTQLVDRYLRDNQCQHGLYVVGWYLCDQWDDEDRRRSATPWTSLEAARQELTAQAQELTRSLVPLSEVRAFVLDCRLR